MKHLLPLLFIAASAPAAAHLPPGVQPLPSAAPRGRGPLALVNLHHVVLGSAFIHKGGRPDLFVAGYGGHKAVHLFRWIDAAESGAPVFAQPVELKSPFNDDGAIFQSPDGAVHGLWLSKGKLVHTLFDLPSLSFKEAGKLALEAPLNSAANLAARANGDGSYELAFEMSNGADERPGDPWSAEFRPFNASGIVQGPLRYGYLLGAHLPALLKGPLTDIRQITPTRREVYFTMNQLTEADLGEGHRRDLVTGSRQGNLIHYHNTSDTAWSLSGRHLICGGDGVALRHPTINPGVRVYPNGAGQYCDLIACGEGALYYYAFTGKFTSGGAPIHKDPAPVLQEQADLYAGTLPVPTTIDWDGDGAVDILCGNSEGYVLFFKNIGSTDAPKFLPPTRLMAGDRLLHVQAGYSGSLQGLQEARWGYLSPNVADWNCDGLPDILTGDITGNFHVYLNRGTRAEPKLDAARPLYCDGINLHGLWRVRPGVARIGDRMALAIADGDDHLHLYYRIDDFNLEDAGKLTLQDGKPIGISSGPAGLSGRAKLDLTDWNGDGNLDLILGTARVNSIPDKEHGLPMPAIAQKTLGTPLLLINKGSNTQMKFAFPVPFKDQQGRIIQPGGAHETGAVATPLGGGGPNLLICNEAGRLFLIPRKLLQP